MSVYVEVVFPLPHHRTFAYSVPEDSHEKVGKGSRVLAPFGHQSLTGYVVRILHRRPSGDFEIKSILEVLDSDPVFSEDFLMFTHRLADWHFSSWGEMLHASLPPALNVRSRTRFSLNKDLYVPEKIDKYSSHERDVIRLLMKKPYTERYLANRLPYVDMGVLLLKLERKGIVKRARYVRRITPASRQPRAGSVSQLELDFSLDQESLQVARQLAQSLKEEAHRSFFLQAPPESRHAIYLYLIKTCAAKGKRTLVLAPEIGQTQGMLTDLKSKLGESVAVLHSRLTPAQRVAEWQRIRSGRVEVAIGPRSGLFVPLEKLGLVILDEEQDASFYQKENPVYDARRGALLRSQQAKALLIRGSAWPSVESLYQAQQQKEVLRLSMTPQKGFVEILDDPAAKSLISPRIIQRMRRRIELKKEPVLAFCSRRGYASFLVCSRCRSISRCPRCDTSLSFHKKEARLACHTCGYAQAFSSTCAACGGRMTTSRGAGIEVFAEQLAQVFPKKNIVSFDSDEAGEREKQNQIISDFARGRIDILLGTPYLAHRLHLPAAGTVAVFQPEAALYSSDFVAGQRTAQNLRQIVRFLADKNDSELLVQTAFPYHHCIRAAALGRYDDFFDQEIQYRRMLHYPPFCYMAEIILEGENLRSLADRTRRFSHQVEMCRPRHRAHRPGTGASAPDKKQAPDTDDRQSRSKKPTGPGPAGTSPGNLSEKIRAYFQIKKRRPREGRLFALTWLVI